MAVILFPKNIGNPSSDLYLLFFLPIPEIFNQKITVSPVFSHLYPELQIDLGFQHPLQLRLRLLQLTGLPDHAQRPADDLCQLRAKRIDIDRGCRVAYLVRAVRRGSRR